VFSFKEGPVNVGFYSERKFAKCLIFRKSFIDAPATAKVSGHSQNEPGDLLHITTTAMKNRVIVRQKFDQIQNIQT
jgi:hypothetical protein